MLVSLFCRTFLYFYERNISTLGYNRGDVTTGLLEVYQTLFQAGAYNFQSISAVGEKAVWPRETSS